MEISRLESLPEGILNARSTELYRFLDGPSLISLKGENPEPLFVSVLQHGNEDAGWEAIRNILKNTPVLPRSLLLFVGNVAAARTGARRLDGQPDFNRCWPGSNLPPCPEREAFEKVTELVRQVRPFAAIDVHNNSGRNPHYAAINRLNPEWLFLARMFGDTAMYFRTPKGVQSDTFSEFCPAITIECGMVGHQRGAEHCESFLRSCMALDQIPTHADGSYTDLKVYRTVARTTVSPDIEFGFKKNGKPLIFIENLESLNFTELKTGTVLAKYEGNKPLPLSALNENGDDVTDRYLIQHESQLMVRNPFIPAMLTINDKVIRQDCLCYIMEPVQRAS